MAEERTGRASSPEPRRARQGVGLQGLGANEVPGPVSRSDVPWLVGSLAFTFVISFVLSYHRIFWEDEMLGWMLLRDPSWRHMLWAWQQGADGGGIFFYLTGRAWFALFGASEMSFRFYSAMGFGLAFCVGWSVLRRFYGRRTVAFALINTWFFSPPLVTHMGEGRFYGLLMLGAALAAWLVLKAEDTTDSPAWLCGGLFLVNGALVTSHMLGVVYSGTFLLALLALDWVGKRRRFALYASVVASWLLLLLERTAIRATAQVGKPHFWTTPPTLSRFFGAYTAFSAEVAATLFLLAGLLFLSYRRANVGEVFFSTAFRARRPAYFLAGALLLVPLEMTVEGLFAPSLFTNRYLMPVAIAQAFLTAEAITLIAWRGLFRGLLERRVFQRRALAGYVCLLGVWIFVHVARIMPQHDDYTRKLTAKFPKGVPVVCEDAWAFTEVIGRQHDSGVPYVFLLDWPQSMSAWAPRLEVTEFHLMENWRKVGYFEGSILPIDEFLSKNPRFFLLHRDPPILMVEPNRIGNPLFERLSGDRAYQVVPFGGRTKEGYQEAWMVCRGSCQSPGGPDPGPPPVK